VNAKTVTPIGPVGKDVTQGRRKADRRSHTAADWLIGTVKATQERAAERRRTPSRPRPSR
jgi:hypothetical protein